MPLGLGGVGVLYGRYLGAETHAHSRNMPDLMTLGLGGGLFCIVKTVLGSEMSSECLGAYHTESHIRNCKD